ncbi:hypothetical protein KY358_05475, partial [Candidatus Woesearchaeota archaeon]|nr:hypothetical protein [Candidatus Woesearchaeota archaeon]
MKKQARIIILAVLLAVLISFGANAALTDVFRAGLGPLEDFFSGGWRDYEKTLAFVVFFFMFFSVYMIGMKSPSGKKFFGDKLSRPHMVFAFTIALLSSFIIVVSTRFDWINLKYIAWFLLGFLGFYILYSLLSKLLGKKKFWAFLLALLLTLLLLWLFWYLVGQGRPLESFGGIGDWFEDVGAGDRVEPGPPIVDPGQAQPPAAQPPPPAGGVDEGWLNMGNLGKGGLGLGGLIILILLLMFLKKKKGHVTPPGQTKAPGEEAQGAGIGPSQEAARTAAGQPPTIDNAAEV